MANHKQALKRHRQSLKANANNIHFRSMMKTAVKKVLAAEEKGKPAEVAVAARQAESMLAHVAAKGIIPKRRASRKISRMAKRVAAA